MLSWVPIIGDPLTIVAGVMREPFWSFLLIVILAKSVRYLVLTPSHRGGHDDAYCPAFPTQEPKQ